MAKSKSGGTRTYLRGRVGSDVYSIGRDAKGKKQQVVRSLAESVSNPQTQAQMRGRMIMSTIAQALVALRPIVDHSFDGLVGARANIAEFTKRNYALIKADVIANPSTNNKFGLVAYGQKGTNRGQYVIAAGQASVPTALVLEKSAATITITLPTDNVTVGGLKSALGFSSEDYFTLVGLTADSTAAYERFRIAPSLASDTAITSDNIADVFAVEGNASAPVSIASNVITITLNSIAGCCAVIVSIKASGKYIHNNAQLGSGNGFPYPSDEALPTYPVGAQNYLNGGDILGMQETIADDSSSEDPTPAPGQNPLLTVTKQGQGSATVTVDGSTINGSARIAEGKTINISVVPEDGETPTATLNGTSVSLTQSGSAYTGTATMPASDATLSIVTGNDNDDQNPVDPGN